MALVGFGYWGRNLARNLHRLRRLGAICDVDPAALAEASRSYPGVRTERSLTRLLADPALRAVAVATPAEQHHRLARRCLVAGKDVFVEKPLALEVAAAEDLVRLARKRARLLMVGHLLEYHPAVLALKQLVDAGELGEVRYLYSNRLNLGRVRREENVLWSFAPHDLSVMLLLMGTLPEWVSSTGQHFLQHQVADVTMSCLGFPGSPRGHVFVSWLHPYKEHKLVVVGSRRMAVFDDTLTRGKLRVFDTGIEWRDGRPAARKGSQAPVPLPESEPLREEMRHFLACVDTRARPRTDGESGVRVLRVLDACQRSLEQGGRPVFLEERAAQAAL